MSQTIPTTTTTISPTQNVEPSNQKSVEIRQPAEPSTTTEQGAKAEQAPKTAAQAKLTSSSSNNLPLTSGKETQTPVQSTQATITTAKPSTATPTVSTEKPAINSSVEARALVKQTVDLLLKEGLVNINPSKVIQSLKTNFPSEFAQLNIELQQQVRQQQSQIPQQALLQTIKEIEKLPANTLIKSSIIETIDNMVRVAIKEPKLQLAQNNLPQLLLKLPTEKHLNISKGDLLNMLVEKPLATPSTAAPNTKANIQAKENIPPHQGYISPKITDIKLSLVNSPELAKVLSQGLQKLNNPQQSPAGLLANLDAIDRHFKQIEQNISQKYPQKFVKAVQEVLSRFSNHQQLSNAEGVKQSIQNSGIFLERNFELSNKIDKKTQNFNENSTKIMQNASLRINEIIQQLNQFPLKQRQKISPENTISPVLVQNIIKLLSENIQNPQKISLLQLEKQQHLKPILENISQAFTKAVKVERNLTNSVLAKNVSLPSHEAETSSNKSNIAIPTKLNNIVQSLISSTQPLEQIRAGIQLLQQLELPLNTKISHQVLSVINKLLQHPTKAVQQILNKTPNETLEKLSRNLINLQKQIQQIVKEQLTLNLTNPEQTQIKASLQANPATNSDLRIHIDRLLTILRQLPDSELSLINIKTPLLTKEHAELPIQATLPSQLKHAQIIQQVQQQPLLPAQMSFMQQQISEQLENLLSRISATQINTREQSDQQQFIALEIPVRFQEKSYVMQMRIQAEQHKQIPNEKIWTANLAFELDALGPLRIYIVLDTEDVSIQFWSERLETQQMFHKNFSILKRRLQTAGYRIKELQSFLGAPKQAKEEQILQRVNKGEIDERV